MSQPIDPGVRSAGTQFVVRTKLSIKRSARKYGGTGDPDTPPPDLSRRAAQYVRMSTDHQQYSTANQRDAIARYAEERGLEVVRTYADDGCSGLDLRGRPALQGLLMDVASGRADYGVILAYDVSRWGRFQDCDESACYEFLCRRAGIRVEYCAEQFKNDGTPMTAVVKSIKRIMAGEYSRELSAKVFEGKCRMTRLGFRQGGVAGFGLRRMLVDAAGRPRGVLERGQQKFCQTDRVVLVPGPAREVKVLRWIFEQAADHKGPVAIAEALNRRKVPSPDGRPWSDCRIAHMVRNEKYLGSAVFNRCSAKLKSRLVHNPREQWVRKDGAFPALIDRDLFDRAERATATWGSRMSNEQALGLLGDLLARHGYLDEALINSAAAEGVPGVSFYETRFGGLYRAYAHIGYRPPRDCRVYLSGFTLRRRALIELREDIVWKFAQMGASARAARDGVLLVRGTRRLGVAFGLPGPRPGGGHMWRAQLRCVPRAHAMLVACLKPEADTEVLDYYLLWDRCGIIKIGGQFCWHGKTRMHADAVEPLLEAFLERTPKGKPKRRRARSSAPALRTAAPQVAQPRTDAHERRNKVLTFSMPLR